MFTVTRPPRVKVVAAGRSQNICSGVPSMTTSGLSLALLNGATAVAHASGSSAGLCSMVARAALCRNTCPCCGGTPRGDLQASHQSQRRCADRACLLVGLDHQRLSAPGPHYGRQCLRALSGRVYLRERPPFFIRRSPPARTSPSASINIRDSSLHTFIGSTSPIYPFLTLIFVHSLINIQLLRDR